MLLDDAVRARLADAVEALRAVAPDVAWVAPANLHVTLKFLGGVDETRLPDVAAAVAAAAAGYGGFPVPIRGLGGFPSATRPIAMLNSASA
ncbi:MAG: hypothetical protein HY216_02995, partial [Candidatus Rokubacteria bacterium]|nr:hypothetical protein [Candidatus Rokubacteria bacterium]